MQGAEGVLGAGQGGAVHQLAVFIFHPDAGIGLEAVEEAAQAEQLAPQILGDGDADGVVHAVAVKVGLGEGFGGSQHFVHGGGDGQAQLFQPVGANPQKVRDHQGAVHIGQAVQMAVDGGGVEGRGAGFHHDFLGEIGSIGFVDILQGHDQVGFRQLLELQGVDVHELGNVAHAQGDVQLLVVFVAALDDPVVIDDHVQGVAVQVAPEVIGHGFIGMLGEVVGVQGVVRAADEVDGHGLVILSEGIGFFFRQGSAGGQHREGQHQRQNSRQLFHGSSSLQDEMIGSPGTLRTTFNHIFRLLLLFFNRIHSTYIAQY